MIIHKHKCIFTHIPKCGGSSIYQSLSGSEAYSNHNRLPKDLNDQTKNYFKFTFTRNPWDRFISNYFYFKKYGRDKWDAKMGEIVNRYNSFKDFALNFNNIPEGDWIYGHFKEQSLWATENHDFTGRFERLQEDFNVVCDKIGIPPQQLPHKNKSNHKHYTEYYDDETRDAVAKKYAKDIEYFGHKFAD